MLRAGPFSDERVISWINRRFVPISFDLSNRGTLGDPAARNFVIAVHPELGKGSVNTPPVMFMTPDGELVGETTKFFTAEETLEGIAKILEEHPEWDVDAPEDRGLEGLARVRLLVDTQRWDAARELLATIPGDRARFDSGRLARRDGDFEAMAMSFDAIEGDGLGLEIAIEKARALWQQGRFQGLLDALVDFPMDHARASEARYFRGLALYHLDKKDEAMEVWKRQCEVCTQDPWVYRADWAHDGAQSNGKRQKVFTTGAGSSSLLGRIGYMGRPNPDLAGPRP